MVAGQTLVKLYIVPDANIVVSYTWQIVLDLLSSGHNYYQSPKVVVLDEADGNRLIWDLLDDIKQYTLNCVSKIALVQTLMFSATMPIPIKNLANSEF